MEAREWFQGRAGVRRRLATQCKCGVVFQTLHRSTHLHLSRSQAVAGLGRVERHQGACQGEGGQQSARVPLAIHPRQACIPETDPGIQQLLPIVL